MNHRVLLDFNCSESEVGKGGGLPAEIRHLLSGVGWETAVQPQADEIFQRMAAQLPASDLPSFVRNTRVQMLNKAPHADLTLGYFVDNGVGRVRIRIRADHNAAIAELGQRTATHLLGLDKLILVHMDLFESRDAEPLAQGRQISDPPYKLYRRDNFPVAIPLTFALIALLVGSIVATIAFEHRWKNLILGDTVWTWYGRLFGPLLMAVVTTGAVVLRDRQRATERRAGWDL